MFRAIYSFLNSLKGGFCLKVRCLVTLYSANHLPSITKFKSWKNNEKHPTHFSSTIMIVCSSQVLPRFHILCLKSFPYQEHALKGQKFLLTQKSIKYGIHSCIFIYYIIYLIFIKILKIEKEINIFLPIFFVSLVIFININILQTDKK